MQKQLNQAEIEQILHFLKQNKVPYFDVQLELVDHFASAIESNWETYPNDWSFCLLYTSPSPRDATLSRMPSSA